MKLRVPTSLELLRTATRYAITVMPPLRLQGHRFLLQTLDDTIFHLQNLSDFLSLLPPPTTVQTFPEPVHEAPATPPRDGPWQGCVASTFVSVEMWWQCVEENDGLSRSPGIEGIDLQLVLARSPTTTWLLLCLHPAWRSHRALAFMGQCTL